MPNKSTNKSRSESILNYKTIQAPFNKTLWPLNSQRKDKLKKVCTFCKIYFRWISWTKCVQSGYFEHLVRNLLQRGRQQDLLMLNMRTATYLSSYWTNSAKWSALWKRSSVEQNLPTILIHSYLWSEMWAWSARGTTLNKCSTRFHFVSLRSLK